MRKYERLAVDSALLKAYKNTDYCIKTEPLLLVRVGETALGVRELAPAAGTFCIMTAYNPKSEKMSEVLNRRQNQRLLQQLQSMAEIAICAPTVAKDPQQRWPDEHGFLLANLSKKEAITLARNFRQNAVVWLHEPGFRAELLICDDN